MPILAALTSIVAVYGTIVVGAYVTTVVLILTGHSWGRLPWFYLKIVQWIQEQFPVTYPRSSEVKKEQWPQLIKKPSWSQLVRPSPDGAAFFQFLNEVDNDKPMDMWNATANFMGSGLSAIVQDDFSGAFTFAPSFTESLNGLRHSPNWNATHNIIFYIGLTIRFAFFLPIRLALVLTSFIWLFIWAGYAAIREITPTQRSWIAVKYSRIFCAGTGVVAEYVQTENRPLSSGFAVSSHLTPNDAHILSADVPVESGHTYLVTGQKHTGIIGLMENMAERIIPTLWLDRANQKERKDFATNVLEAAKKPSPVLFFPEGYCSNNTQLLQFRRAIFVRGVEIFPIAIRQDSRFGDGFWSEDLFKDYMIRLLTSWAVVYKVIYLPSMRRGETESASQFAARVHDTIAEASNTYPAVFDGSFWYKKAEKERVLSTQKEILSRLLCPPFIDDKENMELSSSSLLMAPNPIDRTLSEECMSDNEGFKKEKESINNHPTVTHHHHEPFKIVTNSINNNHGTVIVPEIIVQSD